MPVGRGPHLHSLHGNGGEAVDGRRALVPRALSRRRPSGTCRSPPSPVSRSGRSTRADDVGPVDGADRLAGRVAVHARRVPEHVPRPAVDDAPVRRLRHGRGDQRALPLPARPRADRAVDGVRHAVADGPRLRPPALARARSAARASRSTRSTTCRRCSAASTSARSRVSMTINAPAAIMLAFYVVAAEEAGVPARAARRARSRPTSSRSTSPRRSGASRSTRRCACWGT